MIRSSIIVLLTAFVGVTAYSGDGKPVRRVRPEGESPSVRDLITIAGAAPGAMAECAERALARVPDEARVAALMDAVTDGSRKVRLFAVRELGRIGGTKALPTLVARSLHDSSKAVREAAVDGAKAIDRDRAVRYYVHRYETHGGSAGRAYFMTAKQLSFVQDYDVEVAATAFIADPIISTISEGVVLDARALANEGVGVSVTRQVVHSALRRITGEKTVPNRRGAWKRWLREQEEAEAEAEPE